MAREDNSREIPPFLQRTSIIDRIPPRVMNFLYYAMLIAGTEVTIDGAATNFTNGDGPMGILDLGLLGFMWTMYYMDHLRKTDRAQNSIAQERMFENPTETI